MIEIETRCTSCSHAFTPDRTAFRRGTWRACPRCRGDPGDEVSGVSEPGTKRSQARTALHFCQDRRNT